MNKTQNTPFEAPHANTSPCKRALVRRTGLAFASAIVVCSLIGVQSAQAGIFDSVFGGLTDKVEGEVEKIKGKLTGEVDKVTGRINDEIGDRISNVLGDLTDDLGLGDLVSGRVNDAIGGILGKDAGEAVKQTTGAMGLPNPVEAQDILKDLLKKQDFAGKPPDAFESNKTVYTHVTAADEITRQSSRSRVDSVLGKEGQELTKKRYELTQQAVQNSQKANQDAQAKTVTQDVVKEQIKIQNAANQIMQSVHDSTQKTHEDLQYTNLNLADISNAADANNRARRIASDADAARLAQVSSQVDLF